MLGPELIPRNGRGSALEHLQAWCSLSGHHADHVPQPAPWATPRRPGPPPLVLSSRLIDGGAWRPRFPASPSPGTLLLAASWAGLTLQVEKHRSHSFHMRSSCCGLSSLAGRGAWWRPGAASFSTYALGRLPAPSLPDAAGGAAAPTPPFSLLSRLPPQRYFLGGFQGRAQSLMLFDQYMFSLSCREAGGLELRRSGGGGAVRGH